MTCMTIMPPSQDMLFSKQIGSQITGPGCTDKKDNCFEPALKAIPLVQGSHCMAL